MESLWKRTDGRPRFDALDGNAKTDVLIIGGGISGILCAYRLEQLGVDYMLVEAGRVLGGVTANTTAKLTWQHGLIYDKLVKKYGPGVAGLYYDANREAVTEFSELLKNLDCDFEQKDSYIYSLEERSKIEREVDALQKIGCEAEFLEELELPFPVAGAVRIKNQAQFHPLKALFAIAKGLNIFENTKILEMVPDGAKYRNGIIKAKKIIVATHFPFINKHGLYFLKMYQHRSYVLALENASEINGMYLDESGRGLSFREYNGLLLLGGGGHRTGKSSSAWSGLERFAKEHYPKAREVGRWATQDCKTLDEVPYIGRYSKNTPNLFVATGFNKWGMSSAFLSAMILSDMVVGRPNRYSHVFSPDRSILHPQLGVNAIEAVCNLLTPTSPRCPHLGCALKYNKYEHSWDCPCHGSRFDDSGRVLNNPATDDLKL
ncbi:MAG: FAD-dependent oxidoreductase [Ruminococcaceae bacterium]|nr:FAD-dependent oxidoreductase [Oscillospiraceae bacterium]